MADLVDYTDFDLIREEIDSEKLNTVLKNIFHVFVKE